MNKNVTLAIEKAVSNLGKMEDSNFSKNINDKKFLKMFEKSLKIAPIMEKITPKAVSIQKKQIVPSKKKTSCANVIDFPNIMATIM